MIVPKIFSQIKIDDKDDRYISLKNIFIEELKQNVICDEYEPIAKYVFELISAPNVASNNYEEELQNIFEEKCGDLLNFLIKHAELVYKTEVPKEKDLIDELNEDKANKYKAKFQSNNTNNQRNNYHENQTREYDPNYRGRGGRDRGGFNHRDQRDQREPRDDRAFKVGGKNIVLKNKHEDSTNKVPLSLTRERSRSRDKEIIDKENNFRQHREYDPNHNNFHVPRGVIRGGFRGRFAGFPGMMMGRMMYPNQHPRAPYEKNIHKTENIKENTNKEEVNIKHQNNELNENKAQENIEPNTQTSDKGDENSKKKLVRCNKWPNCKSEQCEYVHPTETCKFFPKCTFGDKCIYIHPNIPCKFGMFCTRLNCAYSHSIMQPRFPMNGGGFFPGGGFPRTKKSNDKQTVDTIVSNESNEDNQSQTANINS